MWGQMGEYGGYGMGGYGLWGGFMMLLFWGLVIVLILGAVRWLFGALPGHTNHHARDSSRRALDILDERYARGEIEREEYLRRREDLS